MKFTVFFQAVTFYSSTSEKEKRGEIAIDGQCRVEVIPDSHSKSPLKTPGSKHHSKFQLFACEKTFEFQASDHRTRLQWVNAFRTAIGKIIALKNGYYSTSRQYRIVYLPLSIFSS